MKTLATQNRKSLSRISTFILLSASALFISSCQKDDMLSPSPQKGMEANTHSEVSRTSKITTAPVLQSDLLSASFKENSTAATFTMLTIDHSSAQTDQQSYKIEIKSDGTVLYTGRKNVAAIGERKFMISQDILIAIRNRYINAKFSELESQPFIFDLATVTTTFAPKNDVESSKKIDYNERGFSKVIDLRKAAENMLNISKYINQKNIKNNLEENMAQQFN